MTRGFPQPGGRHGDDGLKIGRNGLKPIEDFVDHAMEKNRPFFLWYGVFLPHTPHNPPERLLKPYKDLGLPLSIAKYYAMCTWFDETCGQLIDLLEKRNKTQEFISNGGRFSFPEDTSIRDSEWTVVPPPQDVANRNVEITGPVDLSLIHISEPTRR